MNARKVFKEMAVYSLQKHSAKTLRLVGHQVGTVKAHAELTDHADVSTLQPAYLGVLHGKLCNPWIKTILHFPSII